MIQVVILPLLDLIMVENSSPKNLIIFVLNMGSRDNTPHPILHNRMGWLKGETALSQRCPDVCCRTGVFLTGFGQRQCLE
jgi:hypothetical protein